MTSHSAETERAAEHSLGESIRQRRERLGLSVRTLAARAGFSPSFISQVENGLASPSIGSLEKLASCLEVSLSELFQSNAEIQPAVVRAKARLRVESVWSQAEIESLHAGRGSRLEPLLITLQPGGASGKKPHAVEREQFVFVVEGAVQLTLDDEPQVLHKGDAVTVRSGHPSMWTNASARPVVLLFVSPASARG
ncbi:cupin domain-containing protein [Silvibacterium sp.]|uniref:cupin domain-containing protein n=1 Tax=Silvibacterium sp. TaxID=1964179 RepID=UPI0039E360D3